jgi:hypothetical protein
MFKANKHENYAESFELRNFFFRFPAAVIITKVLEKPEAPVYTKGGGKNRLI